MHTIGTVLNYYKFGLPLLQFQIFILINVNYIYIYIYIYIGSNSLALQEHSFDTKVGEIIAYTFYDAYSTFSCVVAIYFKIGSVFALSFILIY